MEAYIDDMLVKSKARNDHIADLSEAFSAMNKVGMKLNPKKSFFGLTGGKFMGFMVSQRGIEIHSSKSQDIINMKPLKNVKELQRLTGRLAALNRFIAKSGEVCFPFKKGWEVRMGLKMRRGFRKGQELFGKPTLYEQTKGRPTSHVVLSNG
jgi:hypothetical protein